MAIENELPQGDAPGVIPGEQAPDTNEAPEGEQIAQQTSSIEDRAREQGWKPKEEYEGDSSKWVSAETFVAKGELISKIESLGKKLKESDKAIAMLKEHHSRVKETEFKNAVAFLKSQKKEAYEQGDVDKIIELDDKLAEVRETQKQQAAAIAAEKQGDGENHPDFQSWVEENNWYTKNSELKMEADAIGVAYKANNPNKSPSEILEYVTARIKKGNPEYFQNQNRNRPSAVEGSNSRPSMSRDSFLLTEEEKKVMNTFIRQGVMTKDEYIAEIKKVRGAL